MPDAAATTVQTDELNRMLEGSFTSIANGAQALGLGLASNPDLCAPYQIADTGSSACLFSASLFFCCMMSAWDERRHLISSPPGLRSNYKTFLTSALCTISPDVACAYSF